MRKEENAYQSWLWGEVLLFGLLGALLALFVTYPGLRPTFELPQVRLVLNTMVAFAAALVAVLAGVRFSVDGRRLDWLLCGGFSLAAVRRSSLGSRLSLAMACRTGADHGARLGEEQSELQSSRDIVR